MDWDLAIFWRAIFPPTAVWLYVFTRITVTTNKVKAPLRNLAMKIPNYKKESLQ